MSQETSLYTSPSPNDSNQAESPEEVELRDVEARDAEAREVEASDAETAATPSGNDEPMPAPEAPSTESPTQDAEAQADQADATTLEDASKFWRMQGTLDQLKAPQPYTNSALERMGAPPFPRSTFRWMGYLASVYEHVSEATRRTTPEDPAPTTESTAPAPDEPASQE